MSPSSSPEGLQLIHTAGSSSEAEMLRQILADAGYHVEFVPTELTGIFGTTGSADLYVPKSEAEAAAKFLNEYFSQSEE